MKKAKKSIIFLLVLVIGFCTRYKKESIELVKMAKDLAK